MMVKGECGYLGKGRVELVERGSGGRVYTVCIREKIRRRNKKENEMMDRRFKEHVR